MLASSVQYLGNIAYKISPIRLIKPKYIMHLKHTKYKEKKEVLTIITVIKRK